MSQEFLDIVDEQNNLTGERKSRSEVHRTGLWHRTVHIYFFRKKNQSLEFLVHLRAKTKDLNPNKWDTRFGGHIKTGQSVENTVVDEIRSEVGLDVNVSDSIEGSFLKREKYPNNEFTKVYYYEFTGDTETLKFSDKEVQAVKWMPAEAIVDAVEKEPNRWSTRPESFREILGVLKTKLDY